MKKRIGLIAVIVLVICAIAFLYMNTPYKVTTFGVIEDNYTAEVTDDGSMIFSVNSGEQQGEWTIDIVPEMFKPDFFNNLEDGCAEFHIIPINEGKGDMVIRFTSEDGNVEQYTLALSISRHKKHYLQIDTVEFSKRNTSGDITDEKITTEGTQFIGTPAIPEDAATMQGIVLEIGNGNMIVKPVEDAIELKSSDRFSVPMEHMDVSPEPQVGYKVEIFYDGSIEETYPAMLGTVYFVRVVVESDTSDCKAFNQGGAVAISIDGVNYYGIGLPIPVEPDESVIEYVEIPANHGEVTITAFARMEEGKMIACLIDGEWYQFHSMEVLASSQLALDMPDDDEKVEICQNWLYENESDDIIATITNMDNPALKILNDLPNQGSYLSLTEDSGAGPFYEVAFTTTADEMLGPITFLLNQKADIIGIYYRE